MSLYLRVCIWFLTFSALCGISYAYADKIYLKDGTVQDSERVWLSENYVHFILKGTTGVAIRYAKEIVDRVMIDGVDKQVTTAPPPDPPKTLVPIRPTPPAPDGEKSSPAVTPEPEKGAKPPIIDQKIIQENKGVSFYNPRRDKRYWVSRNSKHNTLNAALRALAQTYGHSVAWVEAHMGDENDLGVIHRNLMMRQGEPQSETTDASAANPPIQPAYKGSFYTRGAENPYRIGPNKRFKSQSAAVKALARQYGRSVEWVQDNFGQDNELNTIHENLTKAMQNPTLPETPKPMPQPKVMPKPKEEIAPKPEAAAVVKGKVFYNPRRKVKYWIGEKERYNSLEDALNALSKKYDVPVEWIERHMGDTNDLNQIHRNLQKSLE